MEGVIWEDVVFAELLFAQSRRIVTLPKELMHYRVRPNSVSNFSGVKQKNLPPFVKPLQRHFIDANEAWAYFSAYSWVILVKEFVEFCERYGDKVLCKRLKECFLGHLLSESCAIMRFKDDPYDAKDISVKLVRQFGKQYLPKGKRHFRCYGNPILWHSYNFYEWLKGVERKLRHRWRRKKS